MKKAIAIFLLAIFTININVFASGNLTGKTIFLDAGHSEGYNTYKDYSEGTTMFILANKIKPLLEAKGATVYMVRQDKNDVTLNKRAGIINDLSLKTLKTEYENRLKSNPNDTAIISKINEIDKMLEVTNLLVTNPTKYGPVYLNSPYKKNATIHPDLKKIFDLQSDSYITDNVLVVSLHTNAASSTSANGADAYHSGSEINYYNYTSTAYARQFSNIILDKLEKIGLTKRKAQTSNFVVVREHNVPAVLMENGFHTNDSDRAKLSDDAFLTAVANAYSEAFSEYFNSFKTPIKNFTDVFDDEWYADSVIYVLDNNLFNGVSKTKFAPYEKMNRAMLLTVLQRIDNNKTGKNTDLLEFSDIQSTDWFYNAFLWADNLDILENANLISNNKVNPLQGVNREETAKIIYEYIKPFTTFPEIAPKNYGDSNNISPENLEAVNALSSIGIFKGDNLGNFNPKSILNRVETATLLKSLNEYLN